MDLKKTYLITYMLTTRDWICLFVLVEREKERDGEKEREHVKRKGRGEREKQAVLWARSPTWGSISRSWDYNLSQKQMLNWLSHPVAPKKIILDLKTQADWKWGDGTIYHANGYQKKAIVAIIWDKIDFKTDYKKRQRTIYKNKEDNPPR